MFDVPNRLEHSGHSIRTSQIQSEPSGRIFPNRERKKLLSNFSTHSVIFLITNHTDCIIFHGTQKSHKNSRRMFSLLLTNCSSIESNKRFCLRCGSAALIKLQAVFVFFFWWICNKLYDYLFIGDRNDTNGLREWRAIAIDWNCANWSDFTVQTRGSMALICGLWDLIKQWKMKLVGNLALHKALRQPHRAHTLTHTRTQWLQRAELVCLIIYIIAFDVAGGDGRGGGNSLHIIHFKSEAYT